MKVGQPADYETYRPGLLSRITRLDRAKKQALGIGLLVTLLQLLVAIWLSPGKSFSSAYTSLCHWDCAWYASIVREGYHSPVPPIAQKPEISNVAFFPGFPYLGRAMYVVFGITPEISLVVIAQVFCVLFWAALWMTLKEHGVGRNISTIVMIAVLVHPASFYLVAGYSESMFLSTLLLYLLLGARQKAKSDTATVISGAAMTATRIVGLPVAIFPILASSSKNLKRAVWVSGLASMGALVFFLYCQLQYGRFDLYMETQRIGWGISPDYLAIFKWNEFTYRFSFDRLPTLLSGFAFVFLAILELSLAIFRKSCGLRTRLPIYAIALMIFLITLSGLKSIGFQSMTRYTLPWYVLLLICFAHIVSQTQKMPSWLSTILLSAAFFGGIAFYNYLGVPHLVDFLNSRWFA